MRRSASPVATIGLPVTGLSTSAAAAKVPTDPSAGGASSAGAEAEITGSAEAGRGDAARLPDAAARRPGPDTRPPRC